MLNGGPIIRAAAKALAFRGMRFLLNAVSGGVLGEAVEVGQYFWEEWQREENTEEARQASLQALAQAPIQEVRKYAAEIVQEVAADKSEAVQQNLVNYLTHVPATVRKSLRRTSDPSGTTIPPGLVLRKADDVLALLPPRLPRFKEGDFPLPSVDLQLVELLGVGGFREVWKARNPYQQNDPLMALKFCIDADAASSLRHEAALLDRVKSQGTHPGIVRLLRTYLRADPPCLEYEHIAGGDLGGLIQEWHRTASGVRPEKAARVMMRLAEIVGFAHRLDPPIVHRDLKPANVLVQKKDKGIVLKVADFGIGGVAVGQAVAESRGDSTKALLAATVARGSYTVLYASPQQMAGLPADPRDDVYALGVIWHQLLTGDLTKGRPGGSRWKERLTEKAMTAAMLTLLEGCFEENREDRPKDAADLATKLSGLLTPASATAASAGPKQQFPSPPSKALVEAPTSEVEDQGEKSKQIGLDVRTQPELQRQEQTTPLEQEPSAAAQEGKELAADTRHPPVNREKLRGTLEAKEILKLKEPGAEEGLRPPGRFAVAVFSPDGKFILSACRSLLIWDFPGGNVVGKFQLPPQKKRLTLDGPQPFHAQPVTSLAFSANGRKALTGGSDGLLRLWDVDREQEIRSFGGGWFEKKAPINSVAFCPEGRFALVGGNDPNMQMWDVTSGKKVRKFEEGVVNTGLQGFGQPGMDFQMATILKTVAFSPDGRHAVSAGDALRRAAGPSIAILWDVQTGNRLRLFEGHEGIINTVVFSPDGRYALSGSDDQTVRLWETASGKEVRRFAGHPAPVHAVAFSPDGRLAVSGNGLIGGRTTEQPAPESVVRIWQVETGEEICRLVGHTGEVRSVSFSPDGQFVLTAGSDQTIRVWAIQSV